MAFHRGIKIDVLKDEDMRALVEKHWPWLLEKLPPRKKQ